MSTKYLFVSFSKTEPINERIFENNIFKYVIYQLERCPTTGRLHWQGFMDLYKPIKFTYLKRLLDDNTIHFEVCRDPRAVEVYSRKHPTRVKGPYAWSNIGKVRFTDNMRARLLSLAIQEVLDSNSLELEPARLTPPALREGDRGTATSPQRGYVSSPFVERQECSFFTFPNHPNTF